MPGRSCCATVMRTGVADPWPRHLFPGLPLPFLKLDTQLTCRWGLFQHPKLCLCLYRTAPRTRAWDGNISICKRLSSVSLQSTVLRAAARDQPSARRGRAADRRTTRSRMKETTSRLGGTGTHRAMTSWPATELLPVAPALAPSVLYLLARPARQCAPGSEGSYQQLGRFERNR